MTRLKEALFDVLVVDIELAEGNGVAVIRQARQLYPPEGQPLIVVLTNYASDFVRDHCFAAGADYFLDKMRDISLLKGSSPTASRSGRRAPRTQLTRLGISDAQRRALRRARLDVERARPAPRTRWRMPARPCDQRKLRVVEIHAAAVVAQQQQIAVCHRSWSASRTCVALRVPHDVRQAFLHHAEERDRHFLRNAPPRHRPSSTSHSRPAFAHADSTWARSAVGRPK